MFGGKGKFVLPLHSQTTGKASQESGSVVSERRTKLRRGRLNFYEAKSSK